MKSKLLLASAFLGVLALTSLNFTAVPVSNTTKQGFAKANHGGGQLHAAMRKLWEDHITWTRNVIFNIIDDLPGTDDAVARLLRNQDDIGDAIKPYYGDDAGKQLTGLLKTHITQAADLLKAAKKDDKATFDKLNNDWKKNADQIAEFLSKANPNWKLDDMKKMMQNHLSYTLDEATARKKKDYKADVIAYDKVHDEILEMADMLTHGIMKQFPDKFKTEEKVSSK
jgi:hypothetical protein